MTLGYSHYNILQSTRIGHSTHSDVLHLCRWNNEHGWAPLCGTPEIQASTFAYNGETPTCIKCVALAGVRDMVKFPAFWAVR